MKFVVELIFIMLHLGLTKEAYDWSRAMKFTKSSNHSRFYKLEEWHTQKLKGFGKEGVCVVM